MFDPKLAINENGYVGHEIEAGQALPDVNGTFPMTSLNAVSGSASRASIPRSNMIAATYYSQQNPMGFKKNQRVQSSDGNWY